MNLNTFVLNPDGAEIPTTAEPIGDFNAGTPVKGQKLCVSGSMGANWLAGLRYSNDGHLCITTTMAIKNYVAGLPVGASGRLCCVVGGPIAFFSQGVPLGPGGRVVLANLPAAFTEDPE